METFEEILLVIYTGRHFFVRDEISSSSLSSSHDFIARHLFGGYEIESSAWVALVR